MSITILFRTLVMLSLSISLSACFTFTQPEIPTGEGDPALWERHQLQASQLTSWSISGKMAIRHSQQSGSGTLNWKQQQNEFDIHFSGPLGQGTVRLIGQPGFVELTTNQLQASAASAELLMLEQLGWSVPLEQLLWWIRGLPAPDSPFQIMLNDHSLAYQIDQSGWRLNYLNYQTGAEGYPLPQRIKVYGPELELTLFIRQWHD